MRVDRGRAQADSVRRTLLVTAFRDKSIRRTINGAWRAMSVKRRNAARKRRCAQRDVEKFTETSMQEEMTSCAKPTSVLQKERRRRVRKADGEMVLSRDAEGGGGSKFTLTLIGCVIK